MLHFYPEVGLTLSSKDCCCLLTNKCVCEDLGASRIVPPRVTSVEVPVATKNTTVPTIVSVTAKPQKEPDGHRAQTAAPYLFRYNV